MAMARPPFPNLGDPLTTEIDKMGGGITGGGVSAGPGRAPQYYPLERYAFPHDESIDYRGLVSLADLGSDADEAQRAREVATQRMALGVKSNRRGIEDEYIGRAVGSTITSLGEQLEELNRAASLAAAGEDFDPKVVVETGLDLATAGSTRALRTGINAGLGMAGGRPPIPRAAQLAPDVAAPGRREAITAVNLRTMPYAEAVKVAESERHLIPSNTGGLVGAPNWVKTPEDLARMRDQFDLAVQGGAPGGRWYTEGQRANREIAGPDPAANRRLARGEGLFSSQANPDTNLGFLLNAHNAFVAGRPLPKVRTGAQAREFNAAAAEERDIRLGKKTGIYSDHLDPTVGDPNTGTNDIWHARSFGYVDDKGKPWDKALTAQQHAFMDAETILAVKRANENKVGGRSDWTPGELQAAAWVYSKGADLAKKRYGGDLARGVAEAAKGYEASFDKYTAHGTYEAIPGAMTRHLTGLTDASQAERTAFSMDPRSRWTTPEGRDILYGAAGMYQRPTVQATGLYTPPGGKTEMNDAFVARPLVGMTGKTGERTMDPASRSLMDAVEAARAYIDVQGAGAYSKPIAGNRAASSTSVQLTGEAPLTIEQMQALQAAGAKLGTPDVIDYGRGAMLTNFGGATDPRALATGLRKGGTAELEGVVPGSRPRRAELDKGYIGYEKAWGKDEGSGAVTRELKKRLAGKDAPRGLVAKFDSDPMIRQAALDRLTRDIEHAQNTGRPIRQDVQLAREIIAKDGFAGLFAALKKGAALPAALAPLISGILAESED